MSAHTKSPKSAHMDNILFIASEKTSAVEVFTFLEEQSRSRTPILPNGGFRYLKSLAEELLFSVEENSYSWPSAVAKTSSLQSGGVRYLKSLAEAHLPGMVFASGEAGRPSRITIFRWKN